MLLGSSYRLLDEKCNLEHYLLLSCQDVKIDISLPKILMSVV